MQLLSFRMFSKLFDPVCNKNYKFFGFIPNVAQSDFTTCPEYFLVAVHLQFPFQKGWYLHRKCCSYQFHSRHCNALQRCYPRLSSHQAAMNSSSLIYNAQIWSLPICIFTSICKMMQTAIYSFTKISWLEASTTNSPSSSFSCLSYFIHCLWILSWIISSHPKFSLHSCWISSFCEWRKGVANPKRS